ncbi:MAG: DEAD/DEAH box helicase [Patescibacteria group bacterium]
MAELTFSDLGLHPKLVELLAGKNFTIPSPIQAQAIPPGLLGQDVVGIAQTGTGKTLAFGLPMLERMGKLKCQSLILAPTRELALQIEEELMKIGKGLGLRTAVIIGGEKQLWQERQLRAKPHLIIATPGRLIDLAKQRLVRLDQVKILILDEADRMLDMGFWPQISEILALVPEDRQTMLFSATMPSEIRNAVAKHMKRPVKIEIAPSGTAAANVAQEIILLNKDHKRDALLEILKAETGTALVFTRTKFLAGKLRLFLEKGGINAGEIHSDRSLAQRKRALSDFKLGRTKVLVATDIAARGIDVKSIGVVINFDPPDQVDDYVHRIGRTGRAGESGKAITFITPDQRRQVKEIERLIKIVLPTKSFRGGANMISMPASAPSRHRAEEVRYDSKPTARVPVPVRPSTLPPPHRPMSVLAGKSTSRPTSRPLRSPTSRPLSSASSRTTSRPIGRLAAGSTGRQFPPRSSRPITNDEDDQPGYRFEPKR